MRIGVLKIDNVLATRWVTVVTLSKRFVTRSESGGGMVKWKN